MPAAMRYADRARAVLAALAEAGVAARPSAGVPGDHFRGHTARTPLKIFAGTAVTCGASRASMGPLS